MHYALAIHADKKRGCGELTQPLFVSKRKQESNAILLYNRGIRCPASAVPTFQFLRFRFYFEALEPLRLPAVGSSNLVRGACGLFLRKVAPVDVYTRIFEPGREQGSTPSGFADWPRPFVFRTADLDGLSVTPSDRFSFDLHLFDIQRTVLPYFQEAFAQWAASGIGPGRRRARLDRVDPLGLDGQPNRGIPCSLSLDMEPVSIDRATVAFVTPTELKADGQLVERPEFAVLFARLRDRICTLRALYGEGPLELNFRDMGERAAAISLSRCELTWQRASRTSRRTGQTHPIGGFTGEAEYHGVLAEFLPWLRAGRWTGVGRQTVWGKGELRVDANLQNSNANQI